MLSWCGSAAACRAASGWEWDNRLDFDRSRLLAIGWLLGSARHRHGHRRRGELNRKARGPLRRRPPAHGAGPAMAPAGRRSGRKEKGTRRSVRLPSGFEPQRPGYPQSPFYRAIQFAAPLTEQNWPARPVSQTVPQGYPQHIPMHGEQNDALTTDRRVSLGNTIIR